MRLLMPSANAEAALGRAGSTLSAPATPSILVNSLAAKATSSNLGEPLTGHRP